VNKARILRNFHDQLMATYGPQEWWPAETALEVIVGAYLTQNTSWRAVERSIANLHERGVMHLASLREICEEELRLLIRPSGYMVRKAAALKASSHFSTGNTRVPCPGWLRSRLTWRESNCWHCPELVRRRPMPSCSMRYFIQYRWWMSICDGSLIATV
jgi:hypothetical protein